MRRILSLLAAMALCSLLLSSCFSLQGGQLGCNGEPVLLGVSLDEAEEADLDSVFGLASELGIALADVAWYRNGVPIPGASGTQYLATEPGTYWAVLEASTSEGKLRWLLEHTFFLPASGSVPEQDWLYIPEDDPMFGIMLPIEWPFADASIPPEGRHEAPNGASIAWRCSGDNWHVRLETNRMRVTPCTAQATAVIYGSAQDAPADACGRPPRPRADVAVIIYGGWDGIPVRAYVGGTAQPTMYTERDAFGQPAVLWTFYPPEGEGWPVTVAPQVPAWLDAERWQYRLIRIAYPEGHSAPEDCPAATGPAAQGGTYVFYFQLVDTGALPAQRQPIAE